MFLQFACATFLIFAALASLYYFLLAMKALRSPKKGIFYNKPPVHNFAILISAHNEENFIQKTLISCAALDYPEDKYRVYVIADNCVDRTVQIARANGAICLERNDPGRRGKGYALEWGFKILQKESFDAVVVLDADCQLERQALKVFDHYLNRGERVLQASDFSANPDRNVMSYAISVGNFIENVLFYAPKSELGLSVFLRGTGMVFHRDILERFPWKARSIAEDSEYSLYLLENGVRVIFVPQARVLSDFPERPDQLEVQRIRWATGNLQLSEKKALRCMLKGVVGKKGILIDAGWTLLVLSRPLVLFELAISLVLATLCMVFYPGGISTALLLGGLGIFVTQIIYFLLGIVLMGLNRRRLSFLINSPLVVMRLALISLMGLIGYRSRTWAKTPR